MQRIFPFLASVGRKIDTRGKKMKGQDCLIRTQRNGLTVLLEVASSAALNVPPSRDCPATECSLKYLSDFVSEASFFKTSRGPNKRGRSHHGGGEM